MGHYCRICGRIRPNEKFSGKGHRTHVCRQCSQLPAETRASIEQQEEIAGFLFNQSHISEKNQDRLKVLASSSNRKIAELAELVLEVARLAPYRRRRFKILAAQDKELLARLEAVGLCDPEVVTSCAEDEYCTRDEDCDLD